MDSVDQRNQAFSESQSRQQRYNAEVYGANSMLGSRADHKVDTFYDQNRKRQPLEEPKSVELYGDGGISVASAAPSSDPESSGVPAGYVETDIILCVNGSPVNGKILFKEDE
jgi:hypothetical protein